MPKISRQFIDTLRISVSGGAGGLGLPKYRGIGGKGGSVYLEAKPGITLSKLLKAYPSRIVKARPGENSRPMKIFGEPGEDKVVGVPVGVAVYDQFMRKIGDLNEQGEKVLVAAGGPGGSPKSSPPFAAAKGHSQLITIDLKLLADVGLVGFPNAGKSTLLSVVSRARPEIAAYAFTTLRPNVGTMVYSDFRQIKVADLPGLIEGASLNLGMGHQFLKHVERSSLLLMVVDIHGFQLTPSCKHRSCLETVVLLNKELELYKEEILDKPIVLAVNKMDLPGSRSILTEIMPYLKNLTDYACKVPETIRPKKMLKFDEIVPISAIHDRDSTDKLKEVLRECLDRNFELSLMETMTKNEIELLKRLRKENSEVTKAEESGKSSLVIENLNMSEKIFVEFSNIDLQLSK